MSEDRGMWFTVNASSASGASSEATFWASDMDSAAKRAEVIYAGIWPDVVVTCDSDGESRQVGQAPHNS